MLFAAGAAAAPPQAAPVQEKPAVPVVPPAPARPPGPPRAISRTEQFRVTGADGLVRGTVAAMAEDAKDELLALTGEKDAWKVPVSIFLHGQQGDPLPPRSVAMKLQFGEAGYDLRVDAHLSHGIEMESFKHTITAALLYERALRGRTTGEPEAQLLVPPWLVEGLREATAWRTKHADRRLYETLFKHGGLFKLDELFAMEEGDFGELDGATRAAFRGSSGALLMALLQQPQGRESFRAFLTEVAAFQGEMPVLLRRHFPNLNLSETSLAKWWLLQLAEMTTPSVTEVMGVAETETALTEALQLHFRAADGTQLQQGLEAWQAVAALKPPERFEAVRLAQDALVRLSYRCFPSFRPFINEYQLVLGDLARGQSQTTAERLAALRRERDGRLAQCTRGRDYLDWFVITQARETSGDFENYKRLKARLAANPHQRADPLSAYLDRMNRIFKRQGDEPPPPLPGTVPYQPGTLPGEAPIDLPPP
ncbi:MAG: hypothetical protein RLZZ522_1595 [Verrucomicrobiota bacterium]